MIKFETEGEKSKYLLDLYNNCNGDYESYINDYYEGKTNISQVGYLTSFISFQTVEIDEYKKIVSQYQDEIYGYHIPYMTKEEEKKLEMELDATKDDYNGLDIGSACVKETELQNDSYLINKKE